ncbi:hypothetical protein L1049_005621 [Liquidambar formosana]|uniref:AAA+ ATPase domain-containing protein n=1 Tax=Liquidambar formosana TaxID=63359 RepID=A0AAP0RE25_LIQFO
MFSLNNMPTTTSVLSAYTTFAASAMLVRTVLNEVRTMAMQLIPKPLQEKILSKLAGLWGNVSSQMTLIIDEYSGSGSINEIYHASELYLSTRISPSVDRLKVSKSSREKNLSISVTKGEKIIDVFEGIQLKWEMVCTETQKSFFDHHSKSQTNAKLVHKSFELCFHKEHKEKVLDAYLRYVVDTSKVIQQQNKVMKLYALESGGPWASTKLDHPSTFDTLAIDPTLKKAIMDDLDRFVRRREFYRKVGKAWKRGYLLHGPPGTGKSSLIAAMANRLKFDIYDLELTSLRSNSDLRRLLVSTANRSILVIEDIDCSLELPDRKSGRHNLGDSQLTLSGLLNFIDGLWSSCGDERIIVFTTNHKEKLDPALLRPGRMDMHIHMSYCTPCSFKVLASNYLGLKYHRLFAEIEALISEVEVSPAEIAEELMKSEDADFALGELIQFLQRKKMQLQHSESKAKQGKGVDEQGTEVEASEKKDKKNKKGKKGKKQTRKSNIQEM